MGNNFELGKPKKLNGKNSDIAPYISLTSIKNYV